MAPVKKSKSVNKGFAAVTDICPSKDEKFKQKKRKLSDMLGSQWSKHELERFYEAYRKYGQDWKKVASYVRSRSMEMVEALYNMNRAYLSLPEGTASVVGLIAMMTDHYNVMGGSGNEKDSEEDTVIARKLQKHPKAKVRVDSLREDSFQHQSIGSSDRYLSLLKLHRDGIQPYFPVRKRTPRVPVSSLDSHPNKKTRGSVMNMNNDEVLHRGLSLTEARQASSSHVPQATSRDTEHIKPSQILARESGHPQFLMEKSTYSGDALNEESANGTLGSNEGMKNAKKEKVELVEAKVFDGVREAYNFANGGQRGKVGSEGAGSKHHRSTSEAQRKRSKKFMFEDERAACDALQTLAEMSLMMPFDPVDDGGESVGRDAIIDRNARSDVTVKYEGERECKKKCKSAASKTRKTELHIDHCRKPADIETLSDEEVKSADSNGHMSALSKRSKSSIRSPDVSFSNDRPIEQVEVAVSSTQVHPVSQVVNPTRRKNSRKRDRPLLQKDKNFVPSACSTDCSSSVQDGVQYLKEKISHSLSLRDVRRWCIYEWFYSAIDYPWFAKREFVEYLDHVGLGHIPRLTRVEWGVVRSSLGKPRRFSKRFLQEEREKLKQYRESVRTHYANLRAGLGEGLPTDLARPLSVGQQVVTIHPKTRELHNGSILTVDRNNCLVQFDRPDLGVELVMDIDCMPLDPEENMPEALRRRKMLSDSLYSQESTVNGGFMLVSEEHMKNGDSHFCIPPINPSISNEIKVKLGSNLHATVTGSCNTLHMQPMKDDMRRNPGLTQSLDGKGFEQHNIYPGNPPCWPQPGVNSVDLNGTIHPSNYSTFSCQETASNVAEIVEGSRGKAQRMVDIAIKVMSLMKEGEDAFGRIGKALDAPNKVECAANRRVSMITPSSTVQGFPHQDPVVPFISEFQLAGDASGMKSAEGSAASDLQVPSNLITSCVATLLMIQTCTERQYPPAEVAQILDNAVTSLHPCCSQNHSIYREIQMCMGRIKTQILALVPT